MTIFINNLIARQQEEQKLPKILACGVGGSLVFHGIAAVALNYLPKQISTPVEVTLINSSEIPPDLRPSPQPPKVKPIPNKTIAKVTPTPTPSVKTTPTPTPTPSVKVIPTPTPTPLVKVKPSLTPQVVKIVTEPVVPIIPTQKITKKPTANDFKREQDLAKNPFLRDPNQQYQAVIKPNNLDQNSEVSPQPGANSSSLNNNRLSFRDSSRSTQVADSLGTEPNSSAGEGNDQFNNGSPGNGGRSQAATLGNLATRNIDKTGGSNGQSLTAGQTGRSPLARAELSPLARAELSPGASSGDSAFGDGSELSYSPAGGSGSSPSSSGSLGDSGNGRPLAPAGTGKFGSGAGDNGTGGVINGGDGFEVALSPGSGGGSRSTPGGSTGNNGNGRSLASAGISKFSGGSNSSGADGVIGDGNEFGGSPGQSSDSRLSTGSSSLSGNGNSRSLLPSGNGKLSRNSGDVVGNGISENDFGENVAPSRRSSRNNGQSYIPELRCLENCLPVYTEEILANSTVKLKLILDESGRVANVSLIKSSEDQSLNNFAENSSKSMRFDLPKGFTKRVFKITMNFIKPPK